MVQEIRDLQELELRLQQADSNQRIGRADREAPKLRPASDQRRVVETDAEAKGKQSALAKHPWN